MQSNFSKDYFDLFGLPVSYHVDSDKLVQRYRELQQTIHPDKHTTSPDQERRLSLQLTAHVNEAFQTLKNPVLRAKYLLGLFGINTADQNVALAPGFLGEQMELRERLSEIAHSHGPRDELLKMRKELENISNDKQYQIGQQFDYGTVDAYKKAAALFHEMQFIDRLLHEIDDLELEMVAW